MANRQKLRKQINEMHDSVTPEQFREYAFGFFLWKHLSECMMLHGNAILVKHGLDFADLDETLDRDRKILAAVKTNAIEKLGFYIPPSKLFDTVANSGTQSGSEYLIDLTDILIKMNTPSGQNPDTVFMDVDLNMENMERTKSALIPRLIENLGIIASRLENAE